MQQLDAMRAHLRRSSQVVREDREQRAATHDSAYAKVMARLESLSLIEQAKGILVAQKGCHPDEAFNLLKTTSQQSNVKVRDMAAEIVRKAAGGGAWRPESAELSSRWLCQPQFLHGPLCGWITAEWPVTCAALVMSVQSPRRSRAGHVGFRPLLLGRSRAPRSCERTG
jgi:hypothetical protein